MTNQTPPDDHTKEDYLFEQLAGTLKVVIKHIGPSLIVDGVEYSDQTGNWKYGIDLNNVIMTLEEFNTRLSGRQRQDFNVREEKFEEWLVRKSKESPGRENNKGE